MLLLVILIPTIILGAALLLGSIFGPAYRARWWLGWLGLIPFISWSLATFILATPVDLPPDYDPAIHGNPGRVDFVATVFLGLVVPVFYLLIALPVTLGYVLIRRRATATRDDMSEPPGGA